MKKVIVILLCGVLCILFGCSPNETVVESATSISTNTTLTEAPASPTPKPTLSEEDKENINKYNELLGLCEKYHDWSAAILIKTMYEEGKITEDQYYELFSISAFLEAKDYDEEFWLKIKSYIESISDVINGVGETTEEDIQTFYQNIGNAVQQGSIYIAIFDSQDKIDRVSKEITYIDNWLIENTEDNFTVVLSFLNSEELCPGERIVLYCYLYYNPNLPQDIDSNGKKVTVTEYFNNNGLEGYLDSVGEELLSLNS